MRQRQVGRGDRPRERHQLPPADRRHPTASPPVRFGWLRVLLSVALAFAASPVVVAAQDTDSSLPFTTSGEWQGLLDFSGYFTIDSVSDDGSFTVKVSDVIGSTGISLALRVDAEGQVTGTMPVHLQWLDEAAGAASNGDPFHVLHDHRQDGVLNLSGTAVRLVASGTLTEETDTVADGDFVEEVSGTRARDVEWIFGIKRDDCDRVTGGLIEASGVSLMGSALLPAVVENGSGSTYHNELKTELLLWPTSTATPEAVRSALDEVIAMADELRASRIPLAGFLLDVVDAWTDLQAEVMALGECQTPVAWDPAFDRSWLVNVLNDALATALESVEDYDGDELMDLWRVGKEQHALDGELIVGLMDALYGLAVQALQSGDDATADEILGFLTEQGYTEMAARAKNNAHLTP